MIDLSLLNRVGCNLAKKDVTVRLRQPCVKGIKGLAMARPGGATIDLSPGMDPNLLYWTFLHEVGHALKHHPPTDKPNPWINLPSNYYMLTKDIMRPEIRRQEDEANAIAEQWDAWAATWAPYQAGDSEQERKLNALLSYRPDRPTYQEFINRSAMRGAKLAIKNLVR